MNYFMSGAFVTAQIFIFICKRKGDQYMLTTKDHEQILSRGADIRSVLDQLSRFREGFPFMNLTAPATLGNGIIRLGGDEVRDLARSYDEVKRGLRILKFVPASGAATRMFRDLFEFQSDPEASASTMDHKGLAEKYPFVAAFISELDRFAFTGQLRDAVRKQGKDLHILLDDHDYRTVIRYLLDPVGLNYASLPKGLISFHRYPDEVRTALEEHLVEGADYCRGDDGTVLLHFTVSPEHMEAFKSLIDRVRGIYEKRYHVTYSVDFSVQKASTDTLAVDMNNEPFRNPDGSLLFRPAGHGALIENLNDLNADVIFIKNIDNIVPDHLKPENSLYKKALGGYLLNLRKSIFSFLKKLEDTDLTGSELQEIEIFARDRLFIDTKFLEGLDAETRKRELYRALNRPVRICGMVRNEGEPGGGPFWVKNVNGKVSLQVVESSQVNMADHEQKMHFQKATHFNPVDLVCLIRDHHGNKFDLTRYVDESTGFITKKSKDGRELRAMELPGLWNGAMADWITVFAEVPLITFNPVKTVNDLLRKEHQVSLGH